MKNKIYVEIAKEKNAEKIHGVLSNAFSPYITSYTTEAYQKTVLTPKTIRDRINNNNIFVLIAKFDNSIVGTVSLQKKNTSLHLFSMAIEPVYQHKGLGTLLLTVVEKKAEETGCTCIKLETYYHLRNAIRFYTKHGFKRTGKTRDYYGIEVFEMSKNIKSHIPRNKFSTLY